MLNNLRIVNKKDLKPAKAGFVRAATTSGRLADLALAGILVSAGLIRLAYALFPRVVRWDEAGHLLVASNLVTGRGYSELAGTLDVHLPPMLPLTSAALLKLGLAPEWATAAIHIVTGSLLCLPIYALGKAFYGRRTGLIAAALVAVYPALAARPFLWSTMTESPFLLFVFSGVWAVFRALGMGSPQGAPGSGSSLAWAWYPGTGIFFGLAYLTRPEGLTCFAVLGLFMAFWHLTRKTLFRPAVTARLALAVIACLLVMSPYVLYLRHVTGHWLLSGKVGLILDIAPAYLADDQAAHDYAVSRLDSSGTEIMWLSPDRFQRRLSEYVLADPAAFFYQVRRNMALTWHALFHEDLFSPWIVALALVGLTARAWTRRRWWHEGLMFAALLPLANFWMFFVISRFLVGALPVGLLWAAAGIDHLTTWGERSWRSLRSQAGLTELRTVAALPLAGTLAFSLWVAPDALRNGIMTMPWTHIDAGRWLAEHTPPDTVIMTRHSEVGLYAGRPLIASPNATWEEILAYGRARNARFLVVDDEEVRRLRPQLAPLLDLTQPEPLPGAIYRAAFPGPARTTLVYELSASEGVP